MYRTRYTNKVGVQGVGMLDRLKAAVENALKALDEIKCQPEMTEELKPIPVRADQKHPFGRKR